MKPGVLAIAIAAGCTVGPKYHVPTAPAPNAPGYKEANRDGPWRVASPADAMLRGEWWKIFHEPELDALETQIDLHNQTLAQAYANYMAARAQIRMAHAQYFPTVSVAPGVTTGRGAVGTTSGVSAGSNGAAVINGTNSGGAGFSSSGRFTSYSLPLEATWAPDLFGRVRNQVRQAKYNAQASAADLENTRLLEHATLAETYFEVRGQDALVDLLDATVKADAAVAETARSRFDTGVDTEIAAVQAEQTLQTARVQATNAAILRTQYEHAIATLVGQPATTFAIPKRAMLATAPPIPVGTPSRLLERRPDVAAAERTMAALNAQIGVGYAAYYPDLTLSASAGFQSNAISSLLSWPSRVWALGATLAETIFDGGLRSATIDQYIAQYNGAVAAYRQTVLAAFQNVEDELAATSILATEVDQQKKNVELAQRAFELEKGRYETGIDPYIDLMQEQAILLAAQQTLVSLQVQEMTSAVALVEALGGGWELSALPSPDDVSKTPPKSARSIVH
jgi:NodT family efflux transporter outer membrane factor (OMF) lipoprotein